MKRLNLPRRRPASQRGVFGILFAIILPVMLGMVGLAIDLAMLHARAGELQAVADGTALAAARALDGTQDGIIAARLSAANTADQSAYRFLKPGRITWDNEALSFGDSPDGPWIGSASIGTADVSRLFFARVDTSGLDDMYGRVAVAFLTVVGVNGEQNLARRAVAGRKDSALGPLAVCALDRDNEISSRKDAPAGYEEALEYGFRRGVTYNLLNLNPAGTSAMNFAINPLDFAPAQAAPSHQDDAALRPFVCSGKIPAPPLATGSMLHVRAPFPASMIAELNSRFGDYGTGSVCTNVGAPPDQNVIDFRGYTNFWMKQWPVRASADSLTANGKLVTVADVAAVSSGTTFASYGPLWSFARAVRYDSATGGLGAPFTKADWAKLYPVASGKAPESTYTAALLPYEKAVSPHFEQPELTGDPARRVLNVPLLDCPVNGGNARMLGIGRFLMTTRATSAPLGVHAEFGGLTTYGALAASAALYR